MSLNRNNFAIFWITLAFVLFPALVHGIPLGGVEQHVSKLDPLEEIVPEEPLPLQIIEEASYPRALPTSAPIIQLPRVNVETTLEAAKEVIAVDQTDVEEKEPINKEEGNAEKAVLSIQVKPLIKLLTEEPSEVTYDLIDQEPITTLAAAVKALKDETSLPVKKIDKPSVLSTTLVPVFEESVTTKPTSHKKQVLLKILDKIVSQVLTEECKLSGEEVLSINLAADREESTHRVEELEEISPNEEKVLLQRVVKALDRYIETGAIESAKVEKTPSDSLTLEEPKSSSAKQVSTSSAVVTEELKLPEKFGYFWPSSFNMRFEKYFLKPGSKSVPRIGSGFMAK